jgi:hypothetical protein
MIINLTPHPLYIRDTAGAVIATLAPSGRTARLTETVIGAGLVDENDGTVDVDGVAVPLEVKSYGLIEGLPYAPEPGVLYVVPLLTALAAQSAGREVSDLLVPGPADPRRGRRG